MLNNVLDRGDTIAFVFAINDAPPPPPLLILLPTTFDVDDDVERDDADGPAFVSAFNADDDFDAAIRLAVGDAVAFDWERRS